MLINRKVKFSGIHEGFLRIYYQMGTTLICFQEDYPNDFVAYYCTKSGEPSMAIKSTRTLIDAIPYPDIDSDMAKRFWSMVTELRMSSQIAETS